MPNAYTAKAEKYARYRWDYAGQAIEDIFERTRLGLNSTAADLGAGTGILTRHLAGRVGRLVAIEPDPGMLRLLGQTLAGRPGCLALAGLAEHLPLPNSSVDVLLVAQAIHWFQPEPARAEIARVLKPGGWLVVLRNVPHDTNPRLSAAVAALDRPEYGVQIPDRPAGPATRPIPFFFGEEDFQVMTFPFTFREGWETFFGAAASTAYAPEEDDPLFPRYQKAMRKVFDRFSHEGSIEVAGETQVFLGQISKQQR